MAVDTTLLCAGYNTYKLAPGEKLYADPMDVELHEHITVQAMAIRLGGTATGQFVFRWLDSDGKKLGNDMVISYPVAAIWQRKYDTITVPTGAVKVVPCIYNNNSVEWHVGCPMVDYGELLRAFDSASASRLAWHDGGGSYVGFLSADQLIAGSIRSIDGKMWIRLDAPSEIVMKGANGTQYKSTVTNPLEVTDGGGNLIGGVDIIDGKSHFVASSLSNERDPDFWVEIGEFYDPSTDLTYHGARGRMKAIETPVWEIRSALSNVGRLFQQIYLPDGVTFLTNPVGSSTVLDLSLDVPNSDIKDSLAMGAFGVKLRRQIGSTTTISLGVDNTGAYKEYNGTKTYL